MSTSEIYLQMESPTVLPQVFLKPSNEEMDSNMNPNSGQRQKTPLVSVVPSPSSRFSFSHSGSAIKINEFQLSFPTWQLTKEDNSRTGSQLARVLEPKWLDSFNGSEQMN